jgi:hypothetical protein
MRYRLNSVEFSDIQEKRFEVILKPNDSMTARIEYMKIYPPPPKFHEDYKCFNKEFSVMWYT